MWFDALIDKGILPDKALRFFVRSGLKKYTNRINRLSEEEIRSIQKDFVDTLLQYPITINIKDANEQHYEVPSKFFETILSAHMKYSGSIWDINQNTLEDSDTHTLGVYSERSEIKDGDSILELGSGWGSLSIYLATKFPNSNITTVTGTASAVISAYSNVNTGFGDEAININSGTITVSQARSLNALTSSTVTGEIVNTSTISAILDSSTGITESGGSNVYTITIASADAAASASDLNSINDLTTRAVDLTNVTSLTSSKLDSLS